MKSYFIEFADSLKSIGNIIIAASLVGVFISGDFAKPYAIVIGLLLGASIQQIGVVVKAVLNSTSKQTTE